MRFEDPEEIAQLVERLNDTCFKFWMLTLPRGGSDYILHIYQGNKDTICEVGPGYLIDGISYSTDMAYISTDLFPD